MGDRKRENLERKDESQSSLKPPRIGFPDLPARGSFTGSDIPYNRPAPQGKITSLIDRSATRTSSDQGPSQSPVGNPRDTTTGGTNSGDSRPHGSSRGVSPSKESPGHSPTKRASRGNSPKRESLTHTILPKSYSIRKEGSPVLSSTKQAHASSQAPTTAAKKKSQSGHSPSRDASAHVALDREKVHVSFTGQPEKKKHSGYKSPQELSPPRADHGQHLQVGFPASSKSIQKHKSGEIVGRSVSPIRGAQHLRKAYLRPGPTFGIKFVPTRHPSLPPEALYDFDTSRGIFIKQSTVTHGREMSHKSIIDDPPPFYGFGFNAHEVEMTVHCAQVQGIINKDPLRLKPPPGVVMHSRSWLIEALRNYAHQQQLAKRPVSQ